MRFEVLMAVKIGLWPSEMQCYAVWKTSTNIQEEPAASIFRTAKLHGVIS
jgi:hypothetical protein